jgi:hypothetical protein
MAALLTILLAIATGVIGGFIGFAFKTHEFRRDQRVKVYGEYIGAFLEVAHVGAGLQSVYFQLGETMFQPPHNELLHTKAWDRWAAAAQAFEENTGRLRLVGSEKVRDKAEELEEWVRTNIRMTPPMMPGTPDPSTWGESAKAGPAKVDADAVQLARELADVGRGDV